MRQEPYQVITGIVLAFFIMAIVFGLQGCGLHDTPSSTISPMFKRYAISQELRE